MKRKPVAAADPPAPFVALSMGEAVQRSEPLARLKQRLRESAERYAVVVRELPGALAGEVRPGPVDEDGWSLLAASPAAAAKLRQLVPRLEARLGDAGLPTPKLRVKVVSADTWGR